MSTAARPVRPALPPADGSLQALRGFALLLLCQSAGEVLARAAALPLPGPVLGLLLLLPALAWAPLRRPVAAVAEPLMAHLSLLFVPVGVGVVVHLSLLAEYGTRIALALVVSTVIGLVVTALVLRALLPDDADAVGPTAPAPSPAPDPASGAGPAR